MASTIGLGILLPLQRGRTGYFNSGFDAMTQTKSNLINLILTQKGERIMQPAFGCDIHSIIFDVITDDIQTEIKASIENAAQIWLPFVTIRDVSATKDEDTHQVSVTIKFSLKTNLNITDTITLVI